MNACRKFISTHEAAEQLGVTAQTIRAWVRQGHLTGYQLPGARAIWINPAELETVYQPIEIKENK